MNYSFPYTESFRRSYQRLTLPGRIAIKQALERLSQDPRHPGLRVKKMQGRQGVWEVRASRDLRITFLWEFTYLVLRSCGYHDRALTE